MNLLLDTHTFLWWNDGKLPRSVVKRIQSAEEVYVSAASAWEVAIKAAIGKIDVAASFASAIADYGFTPLAISLEHADTFRELRMHHRDPFDRLLVAQAQIEGLTIVTRDAQIALYDVPIAWT